MHSQEDTIPLRESEKQNGFASFKAGGVVVASVVPQVLRGPSVDRPRGHDTVPSVERPRGHDKAPSVERPHGHRKFRNADWPQGHYTTSVDVLAKPPGSALEPLPAALPTSPKSKRSQVL